MLLVVAHRVVDLRQMVSSYLCYGVDGPHDRHRVYVCMEMKTHLLNDGSIDCWKPVRHPDQNKSMAICKRLMLFS